MEDEAVLRFAAKGTSIPSATKARLKAPLLIQTGIFCFRWAQISLILLLLAPVRAFRQVRRGAQCWDLRMTPA